MTTSPLNEHVRAAGLKLMSLQMARIALPADEADAKNIIDDLSAICRVVDELVLHIGEYAAEHFSLTDEVVKRYFTNQLRDALEGNGMYEIERAAERAAEQNEEDNYEGRSDFDEHNTLHRAGQGV